MKNKNLLLCIVLLTIIMLLTTPVKAANLNLVVDEEPVESDLKLINGRTLVPAQVVEEVFGAQLEWVPEGRKLKIIAADMTAEFKAGRQRAEVNSKLVPLQVGPRLISGRFFIPLRGLKNIYGGQLGWQAEERTIYYQRQQFTGLEAVKEEAKTELIIQANNLPEYEINRYHQPERLAIDFYQASRGEINNLFEVNTLGVDQVRVSQFQIDPAVVRVVIDLNKFNSYDFTTKEDELVVQIREEEVITSPVVDQLQPRKQPRVVIDPGHGGKDPGALGYTGVQEKVVTKQLATKVDQLLTQQGYKTKLTRTGDEFVSLAKRARLANQWSGDIFLSIHANYNYDPSINGTATYAHWDSDRRDWALAWYVQSELVNKIKRRDNGLKAANFVVLEKTEMPAILIETAFLSNPEEEKLLTEEGFQRQTAQGIVNGVNEYFNQED